MSFLYPSFTDIGPQLRFSWDAGVLDGAIHLTADDTYHPPVQYPPDGRRSAGRVILWAGPPQYEDNRYPFINHGDGEASFNTSFTMSISRSPAAQGDDDGGLLLEVLPSSFITDGSYYRSIYYYSMARTTTSSNISVEIGALELQYDVQTTFGVRERRTSGVYVSIAPAWTMPAANHTVWVYYDNVGHNLSVYVDDGGKPKPAQATLHVPLDIDDIIGTGDFYKYFGLFASKNRSLPSCQPVIYSWNVTVDRLIMPTFEAEAEHHHARRSWILATIVLSSVLVAAAAAIVFVAWMWSRWASWYRALVMKLKLARALRRLPGMPREFKFSDVKKATKNFHDTNRLGSGGFGAVYKGKIQIAATTTSWQEGRRRQRRRYVEVAVKKFTRKEDHGYGDFLAEVAIINRLRHKNIVPLLGWCYENGELLLIYQYMSNGSLDQHLFRHRQEHGRPALRWETRYNIVADVAAALHYVHHEYERVVLHRDIKASNIMLDASFNGRLGDFGLAGLVDDIDKNSLTDLPVAGTWGFIAPEYPVSHKATRKTDVYAFGVLILEVVTGKRSLGEASTEFQLLTDWVWWLHGEGRLLEAVDDDLTDLSATRQVDADVSTRLLDAVEDLGGGDTGTSAGGDKFYAADDAIRLLLLGLACTNPNPSDRPSTAELVQVIGKRVAPPVVPLVKPPFVWPPEGELPLLEEDDDMELDEELVDMSHQDEEPDQSHARALSREGLTLSIGSLSLEIMVCRSRRSLP